VALEAASSNAPELISGEACVACGATAARPLYEVNGFEILQCPCGLARTKLPEGFDPSAIYTEAYFQGGHRDGYADYQGSGDELRYEFRRILQSLKRHVPGGRLIELGCAYGFFLEEAGRSFTACGIEISDHARAVCTQRGLDVVREATPELLAARGPFDAAVMLDVLEHMRDPGEALDRLHLAMRPGAQLVITTGDFGSLLAKTMGKRWRLMTPPQHLWFFSPATVTALLERHGFRVHTVEHPWKLVPLALVAYQASRYVGGQDMVRRFPPRGHLPINLFDAMRVFAERVELVDRSSVPNGLDAPYELASRHAHGRLLDVGCATGAATRALADRCTRVDEVLGIDRSDDAIREATAHHARPGVGFAVADPATLFDDRGFDTILAFSTVEPAGELELVRMIAALRGDGILITCTPTTWAPDEAAFRALLAGYGMRAIAEREHYRPRLELRPPAATYLRHPRAAALRAVSALRNGPNERYVTIAWQRR
jgi:SAM-dependent methyltransferase